MRELGLEPRQPKPWRFCLTDHDGQAVAIPDLVQRDFTAEAPASKWSATLPIPRLGRLGLFGDRHRLLYQSGGGLGDG
jgi:hypothetical protein